LAGYFRLPCEKQKLPPEMGESFLFGSPKESRTIYRVGLNAR